MKHPVKWLIALNILVFAITLLMFGVGLAVAAMVRRTESDLRSGPTQIQIEQRLEKRVGKPYTKDFHETMVSYLRSSDEVIWNTVEAHKSFSIAMFQTGAWISVTCLVNFFLLWKTKRVYDSQKATIVETGTSS